MVMSCLKVYLSSNIFLVCQFKNLLLGRSSPLPLDPISNAPVEFPTLQQNICSRTPSPISSRFHSSSLSNPPPFTYLFYPSPQIQQSCLANRQSTPAWKVGRLTADLPFSFCSSTRSKPPVLQRNFWSDLSLHSPPLLQRD